MRAHDLRDLEDRVRARGLSLGTNLYVEDEVESTNDSAKRAAREGAPHGSLWIAESQTRGRGRQGRAWQSTPGENLLFSVLLRTSCPVARLPELSLVAGLAVRDAVARALGERDREDERESVSETPRALVKWPNDVLVSGKKISGVLVESTLSGNKVEALVVGIGINVHTRDFPEDLVQRATSLSLAGSPRPPDRAEVLLDVLTGLERDVSLVAARGLGLVHARLTRADALFGNPVASEGTSGVGAGIDLEGRLLVRGDDGVIRKLVSGEVHLGLPDVAS
jgi:BirA family biotin operon repressor/biotin-[acetyl-CoA-carboxylase] ligase